MGEYWEQEDIFPSIARVIHSRYQRDPRFISHREIVDGLMQDAAASRLIRDVHIRKGEHQPVEWLAHNMVAWFSQRITTGQSEWANEFERQKGDDGWAYRPTQPAAASPAPESAP